MYKILIVEDDTTIADAVSLVVYFRIAVVLLGI